MGIVHGPGSFPKNVHDAGGASEYALAEEVGAIELPEPRATCDTKRLVLHSLPLLKLIQQLLLLGAGLGG